MCFWRHEFSSPRFTAQNELHAFLKTWSNCSLYPEWPLLVKITYRHVKTLKAYLSLSCIYTRTYRSTFTLFSLYRVDAYIKSRCLRAQTGSVQEALPKLVEAPGLSFSLSLLKNYTARTCFRGSILEIADTE